VWEGDGELCHNEADVNIDMGLRHGVGADSLDPDALGLATGDGAAQQRSQHMMAKYQCELRLKDGAQLDGEPKFATEPPGSFDFGGQPPIRIALGVPATTKGTQIHSPDELPLLTVMLPSMLATIDTQSMKYQYILYIGYELGDKVLDNPAKLERLRRRLGDLLAGTAVQAKVLRFPAVHSTTTLWNALFHAAAADSAQYFLASHDDTEFTPPAQAGGAHSKLWTDAVVEALQRSPMQTNFGVAGPTDRRSVRLVTHPVVHVPTHSAIFGSLYPPHLGNQEHEQWISRVYGPRSTFLLTSVGVYNGHRFSGRAQGCRQSSDTVDFAVEDGAQAVKGWVEERMELYNQAGPGVLRPSQ